MPIENLQGFYKKYYQPDNVVMIIAGVRGTAALLQVEADLPMARAWLSMLVFFDVVFVTLALWTFEAVMTE